MFRAYVRTSPNERLLLKLSGLLVTLEARCPSVRRLTSAINFPLPWLWTAPESNPNISRRTLHLELFHILWKDHHSAQLSASSSLTSILVPFLIKEIMGLWISTFFAPHFPSNSLSITFSILASPAILTAKTFSTVNASSAWHSNPSRSKQ